jgi:hypothetical protein
MKRCIVALTALLAGCGPSATTGGAPLTLVTPLTLEPPPIYGLLGYRSELNLTSDQVVALDSIAQRVRVETAPLVDQLRERSIQRPQRQPGVFQVGDEGRPVLEAIRATHRQALTDVEALLTSEQQATVCRLFDDDRTRRGERPGARREENRRQQQAVRRAVGADSLALGWGGRGRGWPWCAPAPEEPGPS